jgi:hypothetical protein
MGGGDLYISYREPDGHWTPAKNMGPRINSSKQDYCPYVDLLRGAFYFSSDRRGEVSSPVSYDQLSDLAEGIINGLGNIYSVKWNGFDKYDK